MKDDENNGAMGILETLCDSIQKTNNRLDHLESKIDKIWELLANFPIKKEAIPAQSIQTREQPSLFEDDANPPVSETEEIPPHEEPSDENVEVAEILDEETDTSDIPDWEDKEAFRQYTGNLIAEFRNSGMTLKEVAEELNKMGLKTRSGKETWSLGMVNNILNQK